MIAQLQTAFAQHRRSADLVLSIADHGLHVDVAHLVAFVEACEPAFADLLCALVALRAGDPCPSVVNPRAAYADEPERWQAFAAAQGFELPPAAPGQMPSTAAILAAWLKAKRAPPC